MEISKINLRCTPRLLFNWNQLDVT